MSELESPSTLHHPATESRPRHPQREIADLLATAIARMHADPGNDEQQEVSTVSLGFTAYQRVNANPSYQEGVRE